MNNKINYRNKPNLKLGSMYVWIHGREFPESADYWDGNWLNITAHCSASGSETRVTGAILHLSDIETLLADLENLYHSKKGTFIFSTIEPNLKIEFDKSTQDETLVKVHLTPDHLTQKHRYIFNVQKSDIEEFILEAKETLKKYPIVGKS